MTSSVPANSYTDMVSDNRGNTPLSKVKKVDNSESSRENIPQLKDSVRDRREYGYIGMIHTRRNYVFGGVAALIADCHDARLSGGLHG